MPPVVLPSWPACEPAQLTLSSRIEKADGIYSERATMAFDQAEYQRKWREKNRGRLNARQNERRRAKNADEKNARSAYAKEWREKNQEKFLTYRATPEWKVKAKEASKRYREKNPEKVAEQSRLYRLANRDKRAKSFKKWCAANPEYDKEWRKRWKLENPEKYRHKNRTSNVRRRQAIGSHTASDICDILKLQKGRCAICRDKLGKKYHVDHIKPLSSGGTNDRSNLQITCEPCNLSKGARDPIIHMQSLGRLL